MSEDVPDNLVLNSKIEELRAEIARRDEKRDMLGMLKVFTEEVKQDRVKSLIILTSGADGNLDSYYGSATAWDLPAVSIGILELFKAQIVRETLDTREKFPIKEEEEEV